MQPSLTQRPDLGGRSKVIPNFPNNNLKCCSFELKYIIKGFD